MFRTLLVFLLTLGWALPVYAYIGPGAGLGTLGTAIAFMAAIILLIIGFVWYPVKRLLSGRQQKSSSDGDSSEKTADDTYAS